MSSYTVKHAQDGQSFTRPTTLINPHADSDKHWQDESDPAVEAFHKQLSDYGETKLHSLPSVATELGFAHVFLKDESTRFSLPSFKILGASWAIHRAICQYLNLPSSTTLSALIQIIQDRSHDVRLTTCTDGNWGRAVARMAKILGIKATIYVPAFTIAYTQELIRSEGAEVIVVEGGDYDAAVQAVVRNVEASGALMVMDTSWTGYEEVPAWVTEGYETTLRETDRQVAASTDGKTADLVIGSVGVGSWMHAVTAHYKAISATNLVVTVEAETAACLKESLHCGHITSIETGETIMCGMNCGTPSKIAWPVLKQGVFAAMTARDRDAHEAVEFLQARGVNAGPCGAATLVALRMLCAERVIEHEERKAMEIVLFSTEGTRQYEVPR